MKREDDPALWELLGRALAPKLSPFFARDVLREIRQPACWVARLRDVLSIRRLMPVSGLAAAVLAVAFLTHTPHRDNSRAKDALAARDAEVAADLDVLVAVDDANSWFDNLSPL